MKTRASAACAVLLSIGTPAAAHRLDEYLQASMISVEQDGVRLQMRLTPGVAVLPTVLAGIDLDRDAVISEAEQRAYAASVLRDISLTVDGNRLAPRLVSLTFPRIEEMKEGVGEIQLEFQADLPRGGANRRLAFENHHQRPIAAYQVNCLVPRVPNIHIVGQNRNYSQSLYQLDYMQAGLRSDPLSLAWWSGPRAALSTLALLLLTRFAFLWRRHARTQVPDLH